jgi:hypothetical protein
MRLPALASVTAAAMVVIGCTSRPLLFEGTGAAREIAARPGRPGIVVAAPHATSDLGTGTMAAEIAQLTGFGLVVATEFKVAGQPRRRYHVNRPTEGGIGRPASEEVETEGARAVYETYERRVREAAQGPLAFYAELHGKGRPESAERIEIATVGVDAEQALKLRTLLELVRDAHLRTRGGAPRLSVTVEPADSVYDAASGAKRAGILRLPQRALHIELPRVARQEAREVYVHILADFLREATALPMPARR